MIESKMARLIRTIGWRGFFSLYRPLFLYGILTRLGFDFKNKPISFFIKGHSRPMVLRYGTSDRDVFHQIFIEEEYAPMNKISDCRLIVDCGANVGFSSAYFHRLYPSARILALEPDKGNFKVCQKNLERFGANVTPMHAAVYPYKTGLVVVGGYGDGREWGMQVRPAKENEVPMVFSVDINTLIEESGLDRIDLLKIDIERGEAQLFSENYEKWLPKVKNIVIELHDQECIDIFFKAMSGFDYVLSRSGELTVCENISPKSCTDLKSL